VVQNPGDSTDPDASITVELNELSRGRGIGTIAFAKASELSGLKEIYATMRKSNIASQIAATRAGFKVLEDRPGKELILVWRRKG
jgi:RimJ/RimL family protein N-acetyltransferase